MKLLFPILLLSSALVAAPRTEFTGVVAPQEGWVKELEKPMRQEICLNGLWQFQPVTLPKGFARNKGEPPQLMPPLQTGWSATPIKIPSPWNVNTWGGGRREKNLYWPDSVYFPSYPAEWDRVEMGWLRRSFTVPSSWERRRLVLRFEAVAGDCQVLVNGVMVSQHFDSWLPFEVDVTAQVQPGKTNELLVGVRHPNLFNQASSRYSKFLAPYPPGSNTDHLVGIWQDVFLLGLPEVRVENTFVKPLVGKGMLEVELELVNDGSRERTVSVGAEVSPWINRSGEGLLEAPVPKWKLGGPELKLAPKEITLRAGAKAKLTLRQAARLRLWTPANPNLYGLLATVADKKGVLDRAYTRFGWRELEIRGRDLLLNGERIQLMGDFVHPFGPYILSRRHVWAFYKMIKDFGGNAVRPHAQIHPRIYLDLADEMGLMVLAETSVFGSSIKLNPEEPLFWERYARHYDRMVLRDRNHPSVFGWSFGNEMFAIPMLNKMSEADRNLYYEQLIGMSKRSKELDPTRTWISCDGDEDLRGSLPVWSKHFGHGSAVERLPKDPQKPMMVGESGGTYYAKPEQLAVFNGDRAFESYAGRNEALAIDLYDNLVNLALPHLAFFSASETVWFGLEHLSFGYRDFARLPSMEDGVFCTKPFEEGVPGIQLERIPPYVGTLNPGWDAALPLYKPLAIFEAMKAALAPGGPKRCPWDHKQVVERGNTTAVPATIDKVAFFGAPDSLLAQPLRMWGVPLSAERNCGLLIIDGQMLEQAQLATLRTEMERMLQAGNTVLIMLCDDKAPVGTINSLLPSPIVLTQRQATLIRPKTGQPWATGFSMKDLNYADLPGDRQILKCGMAGELLGRANVVLEAANIDWSLFNEVPEFAKCGAVVLYEQLQKPGGSALVRLAQGNGTLALCSLDYRLANPATEAMWRKLFSNMGVKLGAPTQGADGQGRNKEHDLLLNGPVN